MFDLTGFTTLVTGAASGIGAAIATTFAQAGAFVFIAVVGLTKSMALDQAADGVRVNCLCPGRVKTPFVQARLKEYPDPNEAYREMSATQALGRMAMPEEIAAAALYLAKQGIRLYHRHRLSDRWRLDRRQITNLEVDGSHPIY